MPPSPVGASAVYIMARAVLLHGALLMDTTPEARAIADGLKLALRELSTDEPETLRAFLAAVFLHLADGTSKWVGAKLLALLAAAMFTAAIWLISRRF